MKEWKSNIRKKGKHANENKQEYTSLSSYVLCCHIWIIRGHSLFSFHDQPFSEIKKLWRAFYLSPAVPYRLSEWKDLMVRMPLMMMKRRTKMMHTKKTIRKG